MESDSQAQVMDKYTAGIELSNKCREFYQKRMEIADNVKQRLSPVPRNEKKKSSLDIAMEKLGSEMASLMDQDLSLMKQLLTLNEAIEDLKWQSRNNSRSFSTSSCDLSGSDLSVSDTEMTCHSEDDDIKVHERTGNQNAMRTKLCERQCDSTTFELDNKNTLKNNLNNNTLLDNGTSFFNEVCEKLKLNHHGSCDSGINTE